MTSVRTASARVETLVAAKEPRVGVAKPSENGQAKGAQQTKQVTFTKVGTDRWNVEFSGSVTRRDVNKLRIAMLVQWNRMKRGERLKRRAAEREALSVDVSLETLVEAGDASGAD